MAIIGKVEITISSGGKVLQDYALTQDDDGLADSDLHPDSAKIIKYIQATPGSRFELNYALKKGQSFGKADYASFSTWIDGQKMVSPTIKKQQYLRAKSLSKTRDGAYDGNSSHWEKRPYFWSDLLTSEYSFAILLATLTDQADENPESSIEDVKAKYADLGTIRIEFSRKRRIRTKHEHKVKSFDEEVVPEKALKGQARQRGVG